MYAIPAVILWELWKRRNGLRHGKVISTQKIVTNCQTLIHQLIRTCFPNWKQVPINWVEIFDCLQKYRPQMQVQIVTWNLPPQGWIKCNTDGTSKGNPGKSSYGYCIRDYLGHLIYAESNFLGISTNMYAETRGVKEALTYCVEHGWDYIQVETDSLALMNILNKKWQVPWEIIDLVEEVLTIKQLKHIHIIHSYKAANQLADHIANMAVQSEQKYMIAAFNQLPGSARGMLNTESPLFGLDLGVTTQKQPDTQILTCFR